MKITILGALGALLFGLCACVQAATFTSTKIIDQQYLSYALSTRSDVRGPEITATTVTAASPLGGRRPA